MQWPNATASAADAEGFEADLAGSGGDSVPVLGGVNAVDLPCTDDPELFFAESPADVESAKALCRGCAARLPCLSGALERQAAFTSMNRIRFAFGRTLDELELTAADWGNWEDVYKFVQAPNPEFVNTNITALALKQLQVNAMLVIDLDGNVLFNASDYGVNAAGFVIHSAIHMARHDVDCVAHTHTPAGMAVSAMECGLLPLAQTSMRFLHIAYHDFEGIADDVGERERLVADLGDHEAMILRNHGLLVVGRTIPATFNLLYRMERACEVQVMALSCNTRLVYPPQEVLEKTFDKVKPRPNLPNRNGELAWPALLRKLDRVDPSYRD